MCKIEIRKSNLDAAYKVADENGKRLLDALFGKAKGTPNLDDYRSIKTYEDACEALGVRPIPAGEELLLAAYDNMDDFCVMPGHLIALVKLETISRALWGRDFEPKPQAEWDGKTWYWYPYFRFYSKSEVDVIKKDPSDYPGIAALFGGGAYNGSDAGFGYLAAADRPAGTHAAFGFRLCQETKEKARYFAATFADLWLEYLGEGFEAKERII